jgi:hypothetical protein
MALTAASEFLIMVIIVEMKSIINLYPPSTHLKLHFSHSRSQMEKQVSIYEQMNGNNKDLLEMLMGEGGEAFLDRQILKMKEEEFGEEEFH